MNDQRTLPTSPRPDDPFERELRAILRDRAAGVAPARLHEALADVTRRPAPRPTTGWRRPAVSLVAAAAAVLLLAMGFNPMSTWMQAVVPGAVSSPSLSPAPTMSSTSPSTAPAPAIVWDTGAVRMTADALRITTGGRVFTADVPDIRVGGDPGGTTRRTLEVEWQEQGREQRLYLYLAADDVSWWITEVRVRDGQPDAAWITFAPPEIRVPIGGTWTGDLRLATPSGSLEVDGMTLRAFTPDTLPAELRFCRPAIAVGTGDGVDPLADGEPLAGSGIERMTPALAKGLLAGMGLCHTFRYHYQFTDQADGFSEIWCDPPPGEIWLVRYGTDGEVIIFVKDAIPLQHTPRPQPPVGWGC